MGNAEALTIEMMGERNEHNAEKGDVTRQLYEQLPRGGPCDVRLDGVSVKLSGDTVFEPDVTIHCGKMPRGELSITDPTVVIEITSPSSAYKDFTIKPPRYMDVDSILAVVVIDLRGERTTVFRRDRPVEFARKGDTIVLPLAGGETVDLDLARVFEAVEAAMR